ncbi:MAG: S41 family peptidase [Peptostreptococcaceae bacterium]|jgi:carboxyl-terminal processing protease|nr:S41 family peptidase [Peptostreptococcaceae bacterium]
MKKNLAKLLTLTLIIINTFSFNVFAENNDKIIKDEEFFRAIKSYILNNYEGEISEEELIEGAVDGMFEKLDKHSYYMPVDESTQFIEKTSGEFFGIGASIGVRDDQLKILKVIENTPAQKAGLLKDDIILQIDGQDIVDAKKIDKHIEKIRGEKGTIVTLGILRGTNKIDISITRDKIEINPVTKKIIANHIGYLKIEDFNKNVSKNINEAIETLEKQSVKKLVLDLRSNPGGSLSEVILVAQNFIDKGTIVSVNYSDGTKKTIKSYGAKKFDDVVVLINNGSASASEILAGAIQDTNSGLLVGKKSYGKGTVQELKKFKNDESLKLTIGRYYLPSGRSINDTGLVPDYDIDRFKDEDIVKDNLSIDTKSDIIINEVGLEVVRLQNMLEALGYQIADGSGMYNESTKNAVSSFQTAHALNSTGIANIDTTKKILTSYAELMRKEEFDEQLKKAIELLNK